MVVHRATQGMYWEAQGQWDQAAQIYHEMLEADPACEMARKRLVRDHRCMGGQQNMTLAWSVY
jgi:predicted TPR repeat methyltransferase